MNGCKTCESPDQEAIEALGRQAIEGTLSWTKAAAQAGVTRGALRNHMTEHVVAPAIAEAQAAAESEMEQLIGQAKQGLLDQFYIAPDDVKPLILVAIHNLEQLPSTKPTQEQLIRSLKTIQEMTGMKNEQRMLLGFAKAMFGPTPVASTSRVLPELAESPRTPEEVTHG